MRPEIGAAYAALFVERLADGLRSVPPMWHPWDAWDWLRHKRHLSNQFDQTSVEPSLAWIRCWYPFWPRADYLETP